VNLNQLKPQPGAKKDSKRRGRGEGSGNGSTAGRGNNGARARSGYKAKRDFEGGQMPLARRLPKRGFNSRIEGAQEVALKRLAGFDGAVIDAASLKAAGLIRSVSKRIKIIGDAELKVAKTFVVDAVSAGARKSIEAAGGKIELIVEIAGEA
jgi:large subunit ribosomal protein L15